MTLKERIIQDFFTKRAYTVYQTNPTEISMMYDKLIASIKSNEPFKKFLHFEGAITGEDKIRFDRESNYIDPTDKKKTMEKVKINFKYPVYNFLYNEYKTAMAEIKERENKVPLPV